MFNAKVFEFNDTNLENVILIFIFVSYTYDTSKLYSNHIPSVYCFVFCFCFFVVVFCLFVCFLFVCLFVFVLFCFVFFYLFFFFCFCFLFFFLFLHR